MSSSVRENPSRTLRNNATANLHAVASAKPVQKSSKKADGRTNMAQLVAR